MKITEQHLSDLQLNALIDFAQWDVKENSNSIDNARLLAFLELKQRRAEDRQR